MTHCVDTLDLDENETGEMLIPSEVGNILAECKLRHFLIQNSRNYTKEALENISGMKIRVNQSVLEDVSNVFDVSNHSELFLLDLLVQPEGDFHDFVEEKGDAFFEELMSVLGNCDLRGMRGKRGLFLTDFNKKTLDCGLEVLAAKILISTSVFYNDYRVTVSFPYTQDELNLVVESIYNSISSKFSDMKFELSGEFLSNEEEDY